jgi:hypothetical protein
MMVRRITVEVVEKWSNGRKVVEKWSKKTETLSNEAVEVVEKWSKSGRMVEKDRNTQ